MSNRRCRVKDGFSTGPFHGISRVFLKKGVKVEWGDEARVLRSFTYLSHKHPANGRITVYEETAWLFMCTCMSQICGPLRLIGLMRILEGQGCLTILHPATAHVSAFELPSKPMGQISACLLTCIYLTEECLFKFLNIIFNERLFLFKAETFITVLHNHPTAHIQIID